MNRFRTRKKSNASASRSETPIQDFDKPAMPSLPSKSFKKTKKAQVKTKPEFDLASALPSNDDFRTSLLMPKLSARFSMLREQDDPLSKLGKANDDSVLSPKRQSRIGYGFVSYVGGLADIAEVDSIKGEVRPPFANERVGSMASTEGYGTDEDSAQNTSMLNRSRTKEGNNLFGGRQKIYRIPVSGASSNRTLNEDGTGGSTGGGMGGRFLYEYDINPSSFQRIKNMAQMEEEGDLIVDRESGDKDRADSPSLPGYNQNRETSSSTNSGPSNIRTSTAATSIASQGAGSVPGSAGLPGRSPSILGSGPPNTLERSTTKSRRLYEQGLDQQLQDHQSSALSRLESLQRQRVMGSGAGPGGRLMQVQSATSLRDRYDRAAGKPAGYTRNGSPIPPTSPTSATSYESNRGDAPSRASGQESISGNSRPLSPVLQHSGMSEDDASTLLNSIQPQDRGKATALGAFNKPAKQYDEEDFSMRQIQLHQGRVSPPEKSPAKRSSPKNSPKKSPYRHNTTRNDQQSSLTSPDSPGMSFRGRVLAHKGNVDVESPAPNDSVFDDRQSMTLPPQNGGTFLAAPDSDISSQADSEAEAEETSTRSRRREILPQPYPQHQPTTSGARPPSDEHPAHWHPHHRATYTTDFASEELDDLLAPTTPAVRKDSTPSISIGSIGAESPTLGPTAGLNGLVRQHLRTDSNTSSLYPAPSPSVPTFPRDVNRLNIDAAVAHNAGPSEYGRLSGANPWSEWDGESASTTGSPPRKTHNLSLSDNGPVPSPKANRFFGADVTTQQKDEQPWPFGHTREASLEAQREREAFANELANRRRMVQENLRNASRSNSPAPTLDYTRDSPLKPPSALSNILKPKSSRSSIKQENPSKAMKMLGIGNSNVSSDSLPKRPEMDMRRDANPPKGPAVPTPQMRKALRQNRQNAQKEAGQRFRAGMWDSQSSAQHSSSPSPPSSRGRSESGNSSGPPRSRDGKSSEDSILPLEENKSRANMYVSSRQHFTEHAPSALFSQQRGNNRSPATGFPENGLPAGYPVKQPQMFPPRQSPASSFSTTPGSTPYDSPMNSATAIPNVLLPGPQSVSEHNRVAAMRKKSVKKSDISEPLFLSCTSTVDTINLPPGASLSQGSEAPPPLPPINPRRRRLHKAQTVFDSIRGEKSERSTPSPQLTDYSEENSDGGSRLKKSTSEGGGLNVMANQRIMISHPQPPVPIRNHTDPLQPGAYHAVAGVDGAMF